MIFIVGYSRSGTKMMNKILSRIGLVNFVPEIHFFEQEYDFNSDENNTPLTNTQKNALARKLVSIVGRVGDKLDDGRTTSDFSSSYLAKVNQLEAPTSLELYRLLTSMLSTKLEVDPTPRNSYYIKEIADLIPESRFIYMLRDPRDCILSQRGKWKNYFYNKKRYGEALRLWLNYNPVLMAKFWQRSIQQLESSLNHYNKRVIMMKYEDITTEPGECIERILTFINEEKPITNLSFIKRDNTQKWKSKLPKAHAYIIQSMLKEELVKNNYQLESYGIIVKLSAFLLKVYYYLKVPIALLANIKRIGQAFSTIKRRIFGI